MSDSIDVDALLDGTLDDLADMPEFKPFPAGAHRVLLTLAIKKIGDENVVECALKLIETLELADPNTPEEELSKKDDTANSLFFLSNDIGQGKLKALGSIIAEQFGLGEDPKLRELLETAKEIECVVVTGIRIDKNDKSKRYLDIMQLMFE